MCAAHTKTIPLLGMSAWCHPRPKLSGVTHPAIQTPISVSCTLVTIRERVQADARTFARLPDLHKFSCDSLRFLEYIYSQWKCVGYECGQHVDFRVRLYSCQGTQGFPLEFQRRQGPLLQFNRIYQGIVYKLSQRNFVRDSVCKPAQIGSFANEIMVRGWNV